MRDKMLSLEINNVRYVTFSNTPDKPKYNFEFNMLHNPDEPIEFLINRIYKLAR